MAAQQPGQQTDKSRRENQQRTQLHKIRWIIVIIVLILVAAGTVIWLLTLQGTWITIVPLVIFTILGIIIALFQWLFPVSSNTSDHASTTIQSTLIPQLSSATPSLSTMPEIHVHVPPTDHTHPPQSGPLEKRAYRGIRGVPQYCSIKKNGRERRQRGSPYGILQPCKISRKDMPHETYHSGKWGG